MKVMLDFQRTNEANENNDPLIQFIIIIGDLYNSLDKY